MDTGVDVALNIFYVIVPRLIYVHVKNGKESNTLCGFYSVSPELQIARIGRGIGVYWVFT